MKFIGNRGIKIYEKSHDKNRTYNLFIVRPTTVILQENPLPQLIDGLLIVRSSLDL